LGSLFCALARLDPFAKIAPLDYEETIRWRIRDYLSFHGAANSFAAATAERGELVP